MPGRWPSPAARSIPTDESPVAAALREAKEETGLAPDLIEPIGYLDLYLTFSGFRILPTVARVKPDFTLALNPRRSRRGVRSAARLPDDRRPTTSARRATGTGLHAIITRCRSRTATFGASPRVSCGISTSGFTPHDQASLHRDRAVSHPVRALCRVSVGDARRCAGSRRPGRCRGSRLLVIVSLLLVIGSFLLLAQFSGAPPGSTYVPAHIENGKFVPGATR